MIQTFLPKIGDGTGGTVLPGYRTVVVASSEDATEVLDWLGRRLIILNKSSRMAFFAVHASQQWTFCASIPIDETDAPSDTTALNASTAKHGLLPKLPGGTTNFLREDGSWQPASGGGVPVATTTTQGKAKVDHDSAGDPVALTAAGHAAAADPHAQYALDSEKGAASGIATLDAGGKHPAGQIPFGSGANTVTQGNDPRLSDARNPTAHTHPISDVTNLQSSLDAKEDDANKGAASGYAALDAGSKVPTAQLGGAGADSTKFLRGDQSWQVPPGGGSTPTGTGFRHVTGGTEDAAAKLVDTADINNNQVTLAKLADIATARILGRTTAGAGDPEELTAAQVTALLDAFTSTLKGLAPASGGGTTNFLRADGTWAAPSGGGGSSPVTTKRVVTQFDSTAVALAKVTDLDMTLAAGSYAFQYFIRYRSSNVASGVAFNVNFSGTQVGIPYQWRWIDVSSTAATGAPTQSDNTTGQVVGAYASRIARTTAAFGVTISVDVASADLLMIVEGIVEVTASGDLQLYFGSEVAATGTQSIMVGSGLIVTKLG